MNSYLNKILGIVAVLMILGIPEVVAAQEVKLGAGDVIKISVYGQKDLDTVARVSSDGKITFPLVGQVVVAGMSPSEAERAIAYQLSAGNFVRDPQVSLFVQERITQIGELVTILGKVRRPGRFPVENVSADGAETVIDLIALAGGLVNDAADYLVLTRQSGDPKTTRVDLVSLLKGGDLSQNYRLKTGDIVYVPRMEVFYVLGEVNRPGRYRLEPDMTVMQAISVGGGMTKYGNDKGLAIRRRDAEGRIANSRVALTDLLAPDDVIYVNGTGFF